VLFNLKYTMKDCTRVGRFSCLFSLILFFTLSHHAFSQNKTLGVGTLSPNANAALHVESPTANQGFIMPRLSTTQRTAMTAILTASDKGLMLFDTDANTIYVWDGVAWKTNANTKLEFPYMDSVTTATGTNDLFSIKYNNPELKRLVRIESINPANQGSAVSVKQSGKGLGGFFQVANDSAGGTAIYGQTNSNVGGAMSPVGVYGEAIGTGSGGGAFRISNPANNYQALYAETNGLGSAGFFKVINATNNFSAVYATTDATGANASAITGETSTAFSAIIGRATGGSSNGITGISFGDAGSYAILGQHNGAGPGGVFSSNAGIGAQVQIFQPTNTSTALLATTAGTGIAADVYNTNASSTSPVLSVTSAGLGNAAVIGSSNSSSTEPAVNVFHQGTGSGITVSQNNGGLAIDMINGTIKYSVHKPTFTSDATVAVRNGVISISGTPGITITLGWTAEEGESVFVKNNTGAGSITVEGNLMSDQQLSQFIYIDSAWKMLY
jgi:hypothetical protein